MANNQSLTLKLTQEELLLILMRFRMPLIPGMNPELTELNQEQLKLLMGAAERSLLARDLLKSDSEGKPSLEPVLLAIVAACAKPDKTVVMLKARADQKNETLSFNFSRQMVVLQLALPPGIHQFTALPNPQDAVNLALTLLNVEEKLFNGLPMGEIAESALAQARELAAANRVDEAAARLQTELQPESARALAQTLAKLTSETTLAAITGLATEEAKTQGGFSLLESSQAAFLLTPREVNGQRRIGLQPATAEALRKALEGLMKNELR
jgi:hypothetical protein